MRIWFNRPFSLAHRVLRSLRAADPELRFTLICTHNKTYFTGFLSSDEHSIEPKGLNREAYVDWCLEFAQNNRVDVLIPGYESVALVEASERFAAIGTKILAPAPAKTLNLIHDKSWLYANAPSQVPLAASVTISHGTQLQPAVEHIRALGFDACIKPTVSIYGRGFYRFLNGNEVKIPALSLSISQWIEKYAAEGACAPQMVLEYLPGHEYSVDCVADKGRWVVGVVRKKSINSDTQILDDHPDLIAYSRALIEKFALNGMINIQFKNDAAGNPKLLEINPRASGGIGMSCLSGVNLPSIALNGFVDGYAGLHIPQPQMGLRVGEVSTPVIF